jgi:ribose transport system ATP-binding protein
VSEGTNAVLQLANVTKSYTGVVALNEVDFECRPGEVHALVGENGSGKSTLIKVAAGLLAPDAGTVLIDGVALSGGPREARRAGLMTAYQDNSLVGELTVADNIELSFHTMGESAPEDIHGLLKDYNAPFAPGDRVGSLGPGARQLLEVIRVVAHSPKILLLDEPTAVLDIPAAEQLQDLVKRVRDRGCGVVYVSHRLEEVRRLADRLTVLRDGVIQGTHASMAWDVDQIVELMVGAPIDLEFASRDLQAHPIGDQIVLQVEDVTGSGVGPVSINVRAGEIVGIAGAEGNGQRSLLRAIIGVGRNGGSVSVRGKSVPPNPWKALHAGISFQSGDRVAESIFPSMRVLDNGTAQLGSKLGPLGLNLPRNGRANFLQAVDDLGIVISSPYQPISALSGGNQQKVVLSRASMDPPDVLIIDEPTQGVDAKARLDIYSLIARASEDGVAVLMNSSDSSELAGMCDRVYVMSEGAVIDEISGELKESDIVRRFVSSTEKRGAGAGSDTVGTRVARLAASPWVPVAVLVVLMALVSGFAASRSPFFFSSFNFNNILLSALPLLWMVVGQQFALLVGEFDISIGATATLSVVLASFLLAEEQTSLVLALVAMAALALAVGGLNAFLTQALKVSPLVATIGTLGIVTGICILLRPEPSGTISSSVTTALSSAIGFVPVGVVAIVLIAGLLDFWLFRSGGGLSARSVGFRRESSLRVGIRVNLVKTLAYMLAAAGAVVGGLFLAVQVGVGSNSVALGLALPAFAACFLGGAALSGGRGTFIGGVLGAVFLTVISNATQLMALPYAWTQVIYGVILLIAVSVYSVAARKAR